MAAVPERGSRRRRRWTRGDIVSIAAPDMTAAAWDDQALAIDQMATWAQARAVETINWYISDKHAKRWGSRLLRAASIAFAVTGGVLPLVSSSAEGIDPNLGYIFLALAAGCVAFDHFFGLSSGWMRDMAALQSVEGRLGRFHLEWARWKASQATALHGQDPEAAAAAASAALDLIGDLVADITRITESETAQWIAEFSNSVAALRKEATPNVISPQDLFTWSSPADPTR